MRFGKPLEYTFKNHLQQVYYANEAAEDQHIQSILNNFYNLTSVAPLAMTSWYYVIDYSRSQYLLMTNAVKLVCNYDARDFLEGGMAMLMHVFQKDDFRLYNENVFPTNAAFLKEIPREEQDNYLFTYTLRVQNKQKKIVSLMQRGSYITSKQTGLPLYSLGMVTDVTAIKRDTVMIHQIDRFDFSKGNLEVIPVTNNFYYPNAEDTLLTKQEKIILNYMTEGLSSKQISDKLFLSEHTIISHRKNMLRKTNTKNVAELVAFAIRNAII